MKSISMLLRLLAFALLLSGARSAFAQNPHFTNVSANINNSGLAVSFEEVGLGNAYRTDYLAMANASITYACANRAGKLPPGANKLTESAPVSVSASFSSERNGTVSQVIVLPTLTPSQGCANGLSMQVLEVSYSDVVLSDESNNVTVRVTAGTFSNIF